MSYRQGQYIERAAIEAADRHVRIIDGEAGARAFRRGLERANRRYVIRRALPWVIGATLIALAGAVLASC